MFFELVAAIIAGIGAAGVVLLAGRVAGPRLPRWLAPVAAGLAMIAVAIGSEATWGARTADNLPEGFVVVDEVRQTTWWRPWTYAHPQVVRLMALDTAGVRTHPNAPDLRLVDLYLFERWQPSARVPQILRCGADPARAEVTEAVLENPALADWRPADAALATPACAEAGG
ncbi:hypothetical protein R5H30_12565 [Sulfitobacter sp. D35]|uniref:hypothetical protein n=1 Tax=Sulfitobacter sp. D35 TaxID=3083252 RepID=UPI00296ECAA2|nr:hypothetical protein [Sulfitobacter sp. D35]MDW4498820.1 hypothetical protein [Sulfitobacter sp. D35]